MPFFLILRPTCVLALERQPALAQRPRRLERGDPQPELVLCPQRVALVLEVKAARVVRLGFPVRGSVGLAAAAAGANGLPGLHAARVGHRTAPNADMVGQALLV